MTRIALAIKSAALLLSLALSISQPARAASAPPPNSHQQSAAREMKDYQKHQKKQSKKIKREQKASQDKWRKQHHVGH